MTPTNEELREAERVLGLRPIDIDLIVAVRQKDQAEIDRLTAIIQEA